MPDQPIAVVGMAAELPSGEHAPNNLGHEEFHEFLMAKKDSYVRIPEDRMNIDSWKGRGLGQTIAERGSFLKDVGLFDPTEFGIATKDARAMAVSTRKLIELSFLALLDSGIDYRGKNVGCYASATAFDLQSIAEPDEMEPKGSLAGIPCMIANKISYHLDLRGPSIPVDTACSSSAVAMHMGVQAIRNGECDAAVIAGCQLNLRASDFALYTQASILAPDGRCKPFDAGGNGFSRGEGAVVAVLKPLDQALKDGDYIYGTASPFMFTSILGTGVSSCGSMAPVNAPVAEAQANAMERAYQGTDRHPSEVDYVEVHGTGTAAGDPTEANWVGQRFERPGELLIGSVKGNIGHLEIVSFLASLSKVFSIFRSLRVQPNVHLTKPNPAIHWKEHRLRVALEPEPIAARAPSGKLLVSICSSGIGGVNAHAVVESYPQPENVEVQTEELPVLLVSSGLSGRSASAIGDSIKEIVAGDPSKAAEYSVIYGRRSRQLTWRSFAIKKPGVDSLSFSAPVLGPRVKPPLAFLFSGQGPQHLHMGRQLFATYPVFRQSILEMDECYKRRTGQSLIHDVGLFGDVPGKALPAVWPIALILPSITVVQLALFDLLVHLGLRPDVLIGHSAGETALLYASGAGPKEMAVEISIARGEAMTIVEEQSEGTMAAVACSADDANRIIQSVSLKHPDKTVEIACYNSPDAVALAGHTVLIDEAIALATKGGFMGRKIMTRVPVHCSLMELCADKFKALVQDVFARYPGRHRTKVTTYSTCTGNVLEEFTADYFWNNSRNSVKFTEGMANLLEAFGKPVFVEMSPHPVLASYVTELGVASSSVVGPMRRSKTITPHMESISLLTALGQLVCAGFSRLDWNVLNGRPEGSAVPRASLPAYPFAKKEVDYFPELSRVIYKQMAPKNGPLNFPDLRINVATHPELADHLINSEPIMPAAGFIEMGLEYGAKTMWNIKFHSILPLSASSPTPVEVGLEGMRYTVKSRPVGGTRFFNHDNTSLRLHADGYFSKITSPTPENLDIAAIKERSTSFDVEVLYDTLKYFAQYGPSFRRVDQLFVGEREALVRIKGAGSDLQRDGNYVLHPAILDASFHACVHPSLTKSTDPNVYYLPAGVNAINIFDTMDRQALAADHIYAYVTFQTWQPTEIVYDIALLDLHGQHLCTVEGFTVARHLQFPLQEVTTRYELAYQPYGISQREAMSCTHLSDAMEPIRNILQHIVKTCGKKAIRILELHSHTGQILGSQLVETAENIGAVFPAYTVVSKDIKGIPSDSMPQERTVIDVDIHDIEFVKKLEPASFDVIVGTDPESPEVLQRLGSLLTPGAFLFLSSSSSSVSREKLLVAGFTCGVVAQKDGHLFIEAQSPSVPIALPQYQAAMAKVTIIPYAVGSEMHVQTVLKDIDDNFDEPIWLVATEGLDADGLAGFGRTLTKEFPQWNLRLASFAKSYSAADRTFIIEHYLSQSGVEREFVIEEGLHILVPRIVPSPSPSSQPAGSDEHYIPLADRELLVSVLHVSRSDTGLWGWIGTVREVQSQADSSLLGRAVLAVTPEAPSKIAHVHRSYVTTLPSQTNSHDLTSMAPALVFGGMHLGVSVLTKPNRLTSRVIITHSETGTGHSLSTFCKQLGFSVLTLRSSFTPKDLYAAKLKPTDIIFTAADESDQLLTSYIPKGGRIVSWTSVEASKLSIASDPWIVSDILGAVTKDAELVKVCKTQTETMDVPIVESPIRHYSFSPHKSYLLIGGVGSLGPYIALWMYQRGARHIVLTSRSGRRTLEKMADSLPARVFHYVEELPDLSLHVEAADASDADAVHALVRGLRKPMGGCIFLAATFDDRLFFAQDQNSFARSFSSKVKVMEALETVVNVNELDFVISLSSGTIWGNAGQTNYTSANTALDGKLKSYSNAFSIAAPAILDTTSMTGTMVTSDAKRASHLKLCNYLEDGLLKLKDGPFDVYVPPVDFNVLTESLGSSHLYDYMVRKNAQQGQAVDGEDLHETLTSLVLRFVDVPPEEFSADVPLTAYGLDSLSAGRLSFALKPWIVLSQMQLLGDMALTDVEARIAKAQVTSASDVSEDTSQRDVAAAAAEIDQMIEKFSLGLTAGAERFTGSLIAESVVLITGTTGGLGSYFLALLLQDPQVRRVYAFNRPSSSSILERQESAFKDRKLDVHLLSSPKLVFIEGDASKGRLGLEKELYDTIKASITVIVHNAWRLDLNSPLKTFVPNVSATRNLIDLALSSPNAASIRFAFISSIASTQGWKDLQTPVPEDILQDSRLAVLRGYGEGKYVAERIVAASGLQASVFRVGQLCGDTNSGAWALTEWIPMVVKTGLGLDALPDAGGLVSWLAMDRVAPVVLDVLMSPESPPEVLNVIHPRPVTWHSVISNVAEVLASKKIMKQKIPLVPFMDWITSLENKGKSVSTEESQQLPALKLLDRLRIFAEGCPPLSASAMETGTREAGGWPSLSLDRVLAASPTIRAMLDETEMVGDRHVQAWVQYWQEKGMFA